MKKTILSSLLYISIIISSHAQFYTPSGTILGTSTNSNVGIGTDNPLANLHIKYANGVPSANLRLESSSTGQNASTQYVSGGVYRWELGTGITADMNFELFDRVNNKSSFVVNQEGFVGIGTNSHCTN